MPRGDLRLVERKIPTLLFVLFLTDPGLRQGDLSSSTAGAPFAVGGYETRGPPRKRYPMSGFEVVLLFVQLLVPLALIAWVGFPRKRSHGALVLDAAVAASYVVLIALAGLWMALPAYLTWLYAALLSGAAVWNARRLPRVARSSGTPWSRVALGARAVVVLGLLGLVGLALSGRRPFATEPLDLEFPLRDGTYLVVSGGSNVLVNFHLETLNRERARPYRGQSYGVDLVKAGTWGSRATGFLPDDPRAFAIFGDPIHAPCAGAVVVALDGRPDRLRPGVEPESLAGNHVILACEGAWIVLAHMQQGSIRVVPGDRVGRGEVVGRVGNSGSSGEPHLHVHAQTPGSSGAPLGGSPLPITFEGRHLVRNDRVHGSREQQISGLSRGRPAEEAAVALLIRPTQREEGLR